MSLKPIETTPPPSLAGRKEELLSQSSGSPGSGTQVSSTSGVSLGEAIRQTANQGMESWYQLPVEEDVSCFVPGADQTELPTVEEGVLTLAAGDLTHSPLLEIQESGLSPCLPLLVSNPTQGKRFFEETLFQQSELDFAPLRGSLDVSELSRHHTRPLHMGDAVQLAATEVSIDLVSGCFTLSQHPLALSAFQAGDASSTFFLSQHPISPSSLRNEEAKEEEGKEHWNQTDCSAAHCNPDGNKDSLMPDTLMMTNNQMELQKHEVSSADEAHKGFATDEVSFLDSSIPAPLLLELLEKEIGLSSSARFSSGSVSSSSKASSTRDPDKEKTQQVEDAGLQEFEDLGQESCQSLNEVRPILGSSLSFIDSTEANIPALSSKLLMTTMGECVDLNGSPQSDLSGTTIHAVVKQPSGATTDEPLKQLCSEIMHKHQEKKACDSTGNGASQNLSLHTATVKSTETYSNKKNTSEIQRGNIQADLTISSGCSIERGHKDTDISPSFNPPMDDSSLCGRLVDPISQSTPGMFMNKSSKLKLPSKLTTIKSSLQSLSEELSSRSSKSTLTSFQWAQSDQSGHEANFESSKSLKGSSSPTGRIGSLPALNYIEKVGAWNMNQPSEKISFDTLALRGLTGVSPKKKAYSAVADSLNRMLSKQAKYSNPKRALAASFAGPSSLSGLNSEDKMPIYTLPLTRSQSDNIVNIASKDNLQADEPQRKIQKETVQVLTERDLNKSSQTGVLDGRKSNADLTESSEKHSKSSLDTSDPMPTSDFKDSSKGLEEIVFRFNEKILNPFKETAHVKQEKFEISNQPSNATFTISKISKHQFSDGSVNANFKTCHISQSNSPCEQTATESTEVISDHTLIGPEVDNYSSYWPPTIKTLEMNEVNIEERIPAYLHNLGIDQSPSTILKPFISPGTIKELEFSPSELQTVKDSTDTPTKSVSQFEGDSQKDIESSFYSGVSTLSMSIPMGSDVGNDTPLPTEFSPSSLLRSSQERPVNQCNITHCPTKQVELPFQFPVEGTVETTITQESNDKQVLPELSTSYCCNENPQIISKRVQMLIDKFESRSPTLSQDNQTSSSLANTAVEMESNRVLSSSFGASFNQQNKDLENESFVGSRTLKEIRKLLEEAEDITHYSSNPASFCSLKGYNEFSSPSDCFRDSTSPRNSTGNLTPLLERRLSWGSSSSLSKDSSQMKTLSLLKDSLKWETVEKKTIPAVQNNVEQSKPAEPLRRSEPEGCSGAVVDTNAPASVLPDKDSPDEESSGERGFDLQSSLTTEILNGVSHSLEGLEHALTQTSIMCNAKGDSVRESDDSSSADSLAARVASLLKGEDPLTRATQLIQNAEEEQKRTQVWVKMKLVSQPRGSEFDLSEEDRKKIEEIKAELLQNAKASSTKSLWSIGLKSDDVNQWQYTEQFSTSSSSQPSDQSLMHGSKPDWLCNKSARHLASTDVIHTNPSHTVDSLLPCYSKYKSSSTKKPSALHHIQQGTAFPDDSIGTDLHKDSTKDTDTSLNQTSCTAKVQIDPESFSTQHLSDDISKPVTSITFSSRRRSPSPSIFPVHTKTSIGKPNLHNTVEDQTIIFDEQTPLIRPLGTPRACTSLDPKFSLLTGERDEHLQETEVSKDESFQEKDILPVQDPKSDVIEQNQSSIVQTEVFKSTETLKQDRLQEISPQVTKTQSEASSVSSVGVGTGNNNEMQSSSAAHPETADTVFAASPTRKALSCVYLMLSPKSGNTKVVNFDCHEKPDESYTKAPASYVKNYETDSQEELFLSPLRPLTVPKLSDSESASKTQESAYFPVPVSYPNSSYAFHYSSLSRSDASKDLRLVPLHGSPGMSLSTKMHTILCDSSKQTQWQDIPKTVILEQREKASSDAMTQITTESPEKTTFSAEIYISPTNDENITNRPPTQKVPGTPDVSSGPSNQISRSSKPGVLSTDESQPLSYRLTESPDMCFIPDSEKKRRISPVRSDTTIESSHPGSNDAIAPQFPAEVLGSRDSDDLENVTIKHTEGIYSRRAEPKRAWEETEMMPQDIVAESRKHLESMETVQPMSRLGQKSTYQATHHLQQQNRGIHSAYTCTRDTLSPYRNLFRDGSITEENHLQHLHYQEEAAQQGEEDRFSPLKVQADFSRNEIIADDMSVQREILKESKLSPREQTQGYSVTNSQATDAKGKRWHTELPLKQSTLSSGSLDELWAKFTERQRKHRFHYNRDGELSLVQRLDRLARLLQNPIAHSLMAGEGKYTGAIPEGQKHKARQESGSRDLAFHQYSPDTALLSDVWYSENTQDTGLFKDSKPAQMEEISTERIRRILQQKRYLETPSESSSTVGPSKEDPSTTTDVTESEVATQTDSEMVARTETGSSISTIDTARLIRAFGPQKVHVSLKLSQLYNTIDQQKGRAENQGRGSRKALRKEHLRMQFSELQRSKKNSQIADPVVSSDTTSIASTTWGPSPALSNKRNTRLLNKGIQAGDLEIVSSATKRNTRDVGTTFPSPSSRKEMVPRNSAGPEHTRGFFSQPHWQQVQTAGSEAEEKKWSNGILMERKTRKNKLNLARGVSWFVPADVLKSDSKENSYKPPSGQCPTWFEPFTHTKPWREPLREKNMQEKPVCSRVSIQAYPEEVENKSANLSGRTTLQEALKMCRPDFISRSRARVKRLELLMEERQLQSVFESERNQLFNCLEDMRRGWKTDHMDLQTKAIPKKEMVQRSKRMYEQLPEIKKRKEEEKRKEECKFYRLKAQLYKKKVMNNILGRKTPWN
ncbi:centrosome-associated protein ALMS1 [Microcaecilia unicolor]|uniref:Alstrom syndrome protein 1 n=1 Tax=Microcaecilia unicolor TaxID=1415580 RepID=A0A6P7WUJ0_9AMPH|nr:Alstrom syndrome protein 1 [Microcaecilia unicolor]